MCRMNSSKLHENTFLVLIYDVILRADLLTFHVQIAERPEQLSGVRIQMDVSETLINKSIFTFQIARASIHFLRA